MLIRETHFAAAMIWAKRLNDNEMPLKLKEKFPMKMQQYHDA